MGAKTGFLHPLLCGLRVSHVFPSETGAPKSLSAQAVVRPQRQESMVEALGGCAGEWRRPCKASQTLCTLLLPVQTQILTKASLFGGFSLRKFTVKIAQEGT